MFSGGVMQRYDFDGLCRLYGAMFKLAHRDAKRGNAEAANFLDYVVPEWRFIAQRRANENHSQVKGKRRRGAMGQQHGSMGQQHGSVGR